MNIFYRKNVEKLGQNWKKGIPIEVIPMAYVPVKGKLESLLGGDAVLRLAKSKAVSVFFLLTFYMFLFYNKTISSI